MTDEARKALADDICKDCGLDRREHHYNGAAYGVCGQFSEIAHRSQPGTLAREEVARPKAGTQEPVAWQWRAFIAGHWGAWMFTEDVEKLKNGDWAFNFENGTAQARALYAAPQPASIVHDVTREALEKLTGAMRFVLAFYEPGQRYLDTNAWKNAEASARAAFAEAGE